ncbi:hypothetical protein LCGC14_0952860 [marine sediment metagenome]|uniref:Uncharacterized protein n=1 Tax=marine sediment metagenome TaxID=412755 RepID=A0A0F9NGR6_9ZZZZ
MTTPRYRVCNIDLTEEQFFKLQKLLPHGMRKPLFKLLVTQLIELLEKEPAKVLTLIYLQETRVLDILKGDTNENGGLQEEPDRDVRGGTAGGDIQDTQSQKDGSAD